MYSKERFATAEICQALTKLQNRRVTWEKEAYLVWKAQVLNAFGQIETMDLKYVESKLV
jgi:hypothetical protein